MIHSATFVDQQTNVERCVDLLVQWDTARVYSLQNVQHVEKRVGGGGGGDLQQNNCHNACKPPLEKRIKNRGKSKTIVKFGKWPVLGHF